MITYPQLHIIKFTGLQNLTSGALALTTAFGKAWQLDEVNIKFDGAVTETVTIVRDEKTGASYDVILKTEALSSATDFSWRPPSGGKVLLQSGDEIKVTCTNATATEIAYVTIVGHEQAS